MNKKYFWSFIGIATIVSIWFSYTYFDKAIPFVHLSITMTKKQAEADARCLAQKYQWKVQGFDEAVQFEDDTQLQHFVELEGGGKEAFVHMIDKGYHQPYKWRVRFFKEKEISETFVYFTPDGKPYGFSQKIPEDQPGNNISKAKAQEVVEKKAQDWNVDLHYYKFIEYEETAQPSKRIDHTFTYEREDVTLNKGLYRVQITVSGDEVTGLRRYVKVPDEFVRRYTEMRSLNVLLTIFGQGIELVLYVFIIALFGLLFLYRKRYLLTSYVVKMSLFFGAMMVLFSLNKWPLIWNNYITTVPKSTFIMQQVGQIIMGVIIFTSFVGFICLVAEAMGRYVFKNHVQWFKLATWQAVGSYTVAEQVILGYCGAAIMLAFMFAFYMLANAWGWWAPLQNKIDPNVLSLHVPFFSPVAMSFYAGFFEEFSSRALPIAGILLLARNWNSKRFWFWAMIVVQALLFGAAHANYPMQPAYYRIVEIFIPSLAFAWLYYMFGLLPGIIMHAVYDSVYFLLPVFSSHLWMQKVLGVLAVGIPLWIIIIRWIQQGGFNPLPKQFYNEAWKSTVTTVQEVDVVREKGSIIPQKIKQYFWLLGAVGIVLFVTSKKFNFDTPPLLYTQVDAEKSAQQALHEKFGDIGTGWTVVSQVVDTVNQDGNKFIWQEYGKEAYGQLQGSYVVEPHYSVKYIKLDGSVEQRAEVYGAWISARGVPLNIWHKLPESSPGEDISESKAQKLAYEEVEHRFSLDKKDLKLVSSDSVKHEHRRDWTIIFQDMQYIYEKGQARIKVEIAGNEVVEASQYIFAPEEWRRAEQERLTHNGVFQTVCSMVTMLLYVLFLYIAFRRFGFASKLLRLIGLLGVLFFVVAMVSLGNSWNALLFSFNTAFPYMNYFISIFMSSSVIAVGNSLLVAAFLIYGLWSSKKGSIKELYPTMVTGMSIAAMIVGVRSWLDRIAPVYKAHAPYYHIVNFNSSIIGMLHQYFFSQVIWICIALVSLFVVATYYYEHYKHESVRLGIFLLGGLVFVGSGEITTVWYWLVSGMVIGLLWYLASRYVFTYNIELLLITAATMSFLQLLPSVWYNVYPLVYVDIAVVGLIMVVTIPYVYKKLLTL